MPRAIGSAELSILRDYVNAGAAGRELYYQTLEDWGYRYGRLAGDVVGGETINGRLANAFSQRWE